MAGDSGTEVAVLLPAADFVAVVTGRLRCGDGFAPVGRHFGWFALYFIGRNGSGPGGSVGNAGDDNCLPICFDCVNADCAPDFGSCGECGDCGIL